MNKILDNIAIFIAQGAYSGRAPIAPGTAGTVVGVLLYLLIKDLGPLGYSAVCAAVIAIGTWAAGRLDRMFGTKDNSTIVIDEIAGFLLALYFLPFSWGIVAAGFFLFRAFDIVKPWPLRRFERIPGGPGVMLDDLGAGVYTNIVLQVAGYLFGKG
jgi:phosphatidylglycerophosphatase A